jgi:hypothetical protein
MTTIHSVQFCDSTQNLDITGSPSRERDADEIRVWNIHAECIVKVEKFLSLYWHITGSDHFDWYPLTTSGYRDWREAIQPALKILEIPVAELDEAL